VLPVFAAVARSAGCGLFGLQVLGFRCASPQALCYRPLPRAGDHLLPTIEVIYDVVFFPIAPIQPGYILGDTAGGELFISEVGIT